MKQQRTTIFINPATVKRAKAQAIKEGISFSKFAEVAIEKVLPRVVTVRLKPREAKEAVSKANVKHVSART